MQLVKEDKYSEISGEIKVDGVVDLISYMIDYYAATFMDPDTWCTKQEKRFLIASIIISNRGWKYTSNEAFNTYREVFNLRRQSDIRGLLVRLEANGWLQSNVKNKKIDILEFFKIDLDNHKIKLDVVLKIKNDKVD